MSKSKFNMVLPYGPNTIDLWNEGPNNELEAYTGENLRFTVAEEGGGIVHTVHHSTGIVDIDKLSAEIEPNGLPLALDISHYDNRVAFRVMPSKSMYLMRRCTISRLN